MIIEFYPNPNPVKKKPHVSYLPPANAPFPRSPTSVHNGFNEFQARKKNLTVEEFARRDAIVRAKATECKFYNGQTVYPYTKAEFEIKGMCRIFKVMRTYAEYDNPKDTEWDDNKLFIIEAVSQKNDFCNFRATAGFFRTEEPTE